MMMELKNISIGFQQPLFSGINAKVARGELICLLGTNGVGKSCLIKTIAGLLEKKSGEIELEGKPLESLSPTELAKKIAVVLTEKLHVDYMTVFELVSFGRAPYTSRMGNLSTEDHAVIGSSLALAGLAELKDQYFSELSDGQKQKALIARALAQKPEFLILDEPTTYLDIPSKLELIHLLKKLTVEKKMAVLMSTHDLELVKDKADCFWLMEKERTFTSQSPEEMFSSGLIEKNFFRSGLK